MRDVEITGLAYDSRRVRARGPVLLRPGVRADGHEFAPRRWRPGAAALVVERALELPRAQARVARRAGGDGPRRGALLRRSDRRLRGRGMTGTNGKTTTAFLIRHMLEAEGVQTGLLGTVKRVVGGVEEEVERTTPEAIDLQATFRGCSRRRPGLRDGGLLARARARPRSTASGSPSPSSPT